MINLVNKNYIDDVNAQANQVIEQINKEIETYEKDEINAFKASLEKEIEVYYDGELNDLKLQAQIKISQDKLESKRALLKLRADLADKLFAETEKRLVDFTQSSDYREYLKKKLQAKQISFKNGYFEVKEADVKLFSAILKELKLDNEVKSSDIKIGGFRFTSLVDHIQLNDTLDASLLEQESWFMDHSGFIL